MANDWWRGDIHCPDWWRTKSPEPSDWWSQTDRDETGPCLHSFDSLLSYDDLQISYDNLEMSYE